MNNDLTEEELAAMTPAARADYEALSAQVARDDEERAQEVELYLTREQAEDVLWALHQGLWLYDVTFPEGEYERHQAIHEQMRDLITTAMRRKGMA